MSPPVAKPAPAPTPAPELPLIAAPAAAPIKVATAAVVTPLCTPALFGVWPSSCPCANCLHPTSSLRNWSNVLFVPGKTRTLGPLGTVVHAPSSIMMVTMSEVDLMCHPYRIIAAVLMGPIAIHRGMP